ncbi:hypothetical protein Gohar_015438 [Gossypium harknessii]|uniref:Uncharacterized protein n=1 Tax=Gossypium harknessii TaxID=34285 RepID=A0A7J9FZT8_9ROSI|nr:hypothetical protein [Gossypium harknessii]
MQTNLAPVCFAVVANANVDGDTLDLTSTISLDFMPAAKADMNSLLLGSRETKKVRFKERDGDADVDMVVDLDSQPKVSWKQMLIGKGVSEQEEGSRSSEVECTEDFEFLEGDVQKNYCQWYSGYRVFGSHTTDLVQGYGTMVV